MLSVDNIETEDLEADIASFRRWVKIRIRSRELPLAPPVE